MGVRDYSTTAASNLSVGGVSLAEGMARASVNNGMREQLKDIANLLLDQGGGTTTTGTANAYLLSLPTAPTAYADNMLFVCKFHAACTGPSTVNINGLGVKDVKKLQEGVPTPLTNGDAPVGHRAVCVYSTSDNAVLMLLTAPTFTASGSGAVSRPITSRLADSVHLLDYIPLAEHAAIYAGTSTYDATTAMENCIASVDVSDDPFYPGGPEIILPYGKVHFDSPIQLSKTVALKGHGTGNAGGPGTILEFAADTHGIIVHSGSTWDIDKGAPQWRVTTFIAGDHCWVVSGGTTRIYECIAPGPGNTANAPVHSSGDVTGADGYIWRLTLLAATGGPASMLRDFQVVSLGGTIGHGIWCRQRALVENVSIDSFPGNGVHVYADVYAQGAVQGNANCSVFRSMRIIRCNGNGMHFQGGDANACLIEHIDCSANRGMGVNDQSFLGNTYVMIHTAGNGVGGIVYYGGNYYYLINEALGSTTIPGTDATVWVLWGAGGSGYPHWASGNPYILGYAFQTTSANAISGVVCGFYAEGGQIPANFQGAGWIIISSNFLYTSSSNAFIMKGGSVYGALTPFDIYSKSGASTSYVVTYGSNAYDALSFRVAGDGAPVAANAFPLCFAWDNTLGSWMLQHAHAGDRIPQRFTTDLNTLTGGRSTAIVGGNTIFPQGFWLGTNTSVIRFVSMSTAAPATGAHAAGELVFNSSPSAAASPLGWRCVTTGTPGTWQAVYVSSSPTVYP